MAAKEKAKTRGSSKVLQTKGALLSKKSLESLRKTASPTGVRIIDWCIYGQPAPDGFCGRLRVNPRSIKSVLAELIANKDIREYKILINGQPPRITDYEIDVRMGRDV